MYHVIHDPKSGAVYAAAASEWHGQAIWRSGDLGETWTHSSEGIAYDAETGRKVSKVSTLAVSDGRLLVGVEAPGIFEAATKGKHGRCCRPSPENREARTWDDPSNQPPGHLGISALMFDR